MDTQAERIKYVLSLEKSKEKWRKKHGSAEFKAASDLNNELFGMHLNKSKKCKCVEDMFFLLNRMDQAKLNQINQIKMNQFILKKGKVIMLHSLTTALTSANMTDEKAIDLLRSPGGRGHIKNFQSVPENWEEIVFGGAPPHIPSKSEMKKRAKAAGLPADAALVDIEAAEAKIAEAKTSAELSVTLSQRAISCGLSEDATEEAVLEIEAELKDRAAAINYTGGISLENILKAEAEFAGAGSSNNKGKDSGKGKGGNAKK